MSHPVILRLALAIIFVLWASAGTSAQMPNAYGLPIRLENAKKAAAPALATAASNKWTVAVAIRGSLRQFDLLREDG